MATPIKGFGISGYRTLQNVRIAAHGPLTVLCGPNNTGKSSALNALNLYPKLLRAASGEQRITVGDAISIQEGAEAELAIDLNSESFLQVFPEKGLQKVDTEEFIKSLSENIGDRWWIKLSIGKNGAIGVSDDVSLAPFKELERRWYKSPEYRTWAELLRAASKQPRGSVPTTVQKHLIPNAVDTCLAPPNIAIIEDVRRSAQEPLTEGQLWRLVEANARTTQDERIESWADKLEQILKDVFGQEVRYEVRPERGSGDFRLFIDGQADIRLNNVGAGVREVVAIAYRALAEGGADVITIEEPENCLHPLAVKRLVQSLPHRTGVQLFASTHASSVVNANPDSVVHLTREGTVTTAQQVEGPRSQYEAVRALGYSPSDLVLTPCAIWVEGPSDRLYVNSWLESRGLTEGIDYQIMFFGGALAAHVTVSPDTVPHEALAAIRNLSRYCAVIVDSDKDRKRAKRKRHVRRFHDELDGDQHSYLLVTPGREVENYLPREIANKLRVQLGCTALPEDTYKYEKVVDSDVQKRIGKPEFAKLALQQLENGVPSMAQRDVSALAQFVAKAGPE